MPTQRYGVVGNPIKHSKSPLIHRSFAQETGQDISYDALLCEDGNFGPFVNAFFAAQGRGLNVTVPFKEQAFAMAEQPSTRAIRAKAANTLWLNDEQQVCADNTDGIGLINDITQNHHEALQGKSVLILGAGGAVRGVLAPILEHQPQRVHIANRTESKAVQLAQEFNDLGDISASGWAGLAGQRFDWIINGTSASLGGELPPLPADVLVDGGFTYDMMYSKAATVFQQWSNQHQARKAIDGLGMLVEQAAESFYIWRGIRPATQPVIKALRQG